MRSAPVVLIDCFREGLDARRHLNRALRSLDGLGHRVVRITSADPKDSPMTAAVALALGADSVVVPVRSAAEARAVRAACSYKGSRALNIGLRNSRTTSQRCRPAALNSFASRHRRSPRSSPRLIS